MSESEGPFFTAYFKLDPDLAEQLNQKLADIDKLFAENPSIGISRSIEVLKHHLLDSAISEIYKKYVFPVRRKKRKESYKNSQDFSGEKYQFLS